LAQPLPGGVQRPHRDPLTVQPARELAIMPAALSRTGQSRQPSNSPVDRPIPIAQSAARAVEEPHDRSLAKNADVEAASRPGGAPGGRVTPEPERAPVPTVAPGPGVRAERPRPARGRRGPAVDRARRTNRPWASSRRALPGSSRFPTWR